MTPAQSIQFMLTLPWVMGDTTDKGATYDESEIETVLDYVQQIEDRVEAVEAERDAIIVDYQDRLAGAFTDIGALAMDCKTLRAALVSLVDGKSEFDIEFDTGIAADEARQIMDLAYNRK